MEGQRGMIVAPPRTANMLRQNRTFGDRITGVFLSCCHHERPEEVTDMQRS